MSIKVCHSCDIDWCLLSHVHILSAAPVTQCVSNTLPSHNTTFFYIVQRTQYIWVTIAITIHSDSIPGPSKQSKQPALGLIKVIAEHSGLRISLLSTHLHTLFIPILSIRISRTIWIAIFFCFHFYNTNRINFFNHGTKTFFQIGIRKSRGWILEMPAALSS